MANPPPSLYVYDFTANVRVRILLPTQLLDPTPVGQQLGTGGPALAQAEILPLGMLVMHRVAHFGNNLLALAAKDNNTSAAGVYRKDQGGVDQWGQVHGISFSGMSRCTGLLETNPNGVPTSCGLFNGPAFALFKFESTDGVNYTTTSLGAPGNPSTYGQSMVFRDSIFWASALQSSMGLISYDFALSTLTTYSMALFHGAQRGSTFGIHVHDGVVFIAGWSASTGRNRIAKLQAGVLVTVVDTQNQSWGSGTPWGHNCLFTDPQTGDLAVIWSGLNSVGSLPRTLVRQIENATTTATPVTDRSAQVLGAVEGADKYLEGGGAADGQRDWFAYVDNDTDPLNPRVFLKTVGATGVTETWEWKGFGAEMQLVALGAGIDLDDFSVNSNHFGGGHRSVLQARVAIGDVANPDVEVPGGRKFFFRAIGSGGPFVGTFYVSLTEDGRQVLAPIVGGGFTIESGVPATTPLIVGNTLTNVTPDDGTVLYSIILDLTTAGMGSGAPGRLIGDLV